MIEVIVLSAVACDIGHRAQVRVHLLDQRCIERSGDGDAVRCRESGNIGKRLRSLQLCALQTDNKVEDERRRFGRVVTSAVDSKAKGSDMYCEWLIKLRHVGQCKVRAIERFRNEYGASVVSEWAKRSG